ncbi:MAG: DMT family transporter [Bifidobacteriaceae bacterium]|jgi:drug/metabolite transporter (DMT)-like permease|nr:DMT family transporter [Bifidobacteriaceae bacterium]
MRRVVARGDDRAASCISTPANDRTERPNELPADRKKMRANLLLLAAAMLWGLAFTAQKVGSEYVGAFTFNSVRFGLGAAMIGLVVMGLDRHRRIDRARRRRLSRSVLWPGFVCGSMLTAAAGLQQAAVPDTTAGNVAFVTGLYLVLVPIFGVFLGQRLRWLTVGGIVLALVGLYLIAVTDTFTFARGDGLAMMAAVCFAIQILAVDRYAGRLPALRFACSQFWFCSLTSAVCAPVFDSHPFTGLSAGLIPLLYGGLISVGLAYTFQILAQRDAEPAPAALIMSFESVFGALGGAVILHENMGVRGYVGAGLMMAGIIASQLGPPSRPTRTTRPKKALRPPAGSPVARAATSRDHGGTSET